MVVVSDQFALCKAALIFAGMRWLLSLALDSLITSMGLLAFSSLHSSSSCCSSSSSANLRLVRNSLSLTTLGNIQHWLPEIQDVWCSVCLNRLRKQSQVWELSNCRHVFHKHCLERWLAYDRSTCPLCRASLLPESVPPPATPSWAVEQMLYLFGDDLFP